MHQVPAVQRIDGISSSTLSTLYSTAMESPNPQISDTVDHLAYLRLALSLAKKSPPMPTNFRVGAILVSQSLETPIFSTGYTLELPGNTHAEQCCLNKFMDSRGIQTVEELQEKLPADTVLYTTLEPCIRRLSGNKPCVDRIIEAKRIRTVYVGVLEPDKFVEENNGRRVLETAGIQYEHVPGLEQEILEVATAGHEKAGGT